MGGESSSEEIKAFEDMRQDYEVFQMISDERLG